MIHGNMNAPKYTNGILQTKVKLSACDQFQDMEAFIFQKHSAPYHVAQVYKKWF